MEPITLASGIVRSFDNEYALAGVTVAAYLPAGFPDLPGAALSEPLEMARTVTAADGSFELTWGEESPAWAYACYLDHCASPGVGLYAYDIDGVLLAEREPAPLAQLQALTLNLRQTDWMPAYWDWQQVGYLQQQAQILTLDGLSNELTSLAPTGIFLGWSAQQRLGFLAELERALLDPDNLLAQAGLPIGMAQIQDTGMRTELRQQVINTDIQGLPEVFDQAVLRADLAGGHLQAAEVLLDPAGFEQGEVRAAVNRFFGKGALEGGHFQDVPQWGNFFDRFPWLRSPLSGYRDYLVDIWVKRATQQIQGQLLDANGAIQQLNNRFFQDFSTGDLTDQSANRMLIAILSRILTAPGGMDFGFGIAAAAIAAQEELSSDREYLDYLISLTGVDRHELENRYRLDLSRSDLDRSNPVQQNIDTLQRFFTDSFQSIQDPQGILPPLTGNGLPIINDYTYKQAHGPFFWQYEEWLERNEPFYAENYFDIRRTFKIYMSDEDSKKAIWGRTFSLDQILEFPLTSNELRQLTPPPNLDPSNYSQRAKTGDQWSRILIELQDRLEDAHKDFFAGFFPEAERKYVELTQSARTLQILLNRWKGTAWDLYNPAAFAAEQRAMSIKDPDELEKFEQKYHMRVGYWLSGNSGESWYTSNSTIAKVPYLIELLLVRLLPACLAETRQALGKYRETVHGGPNRIYYTVGSEKLEKSLTEAVRFGVYTGPTPVEPGAKATPPETVWWPTSEDTGSLPFATDTTIATQGRVTLNTTPFPAHTMEKTYFRLKLGDALLEWADVLYRSDQQQNVNRARELYKGVLFLHGEDPEIAPTWGAFEWWKQLPLGLGKITQNPILTAQINRARIGFEQINARLNYYGFPKDYVPPVRYRVLREAAGRFAASAKSTQNDYLNYMQRYEQAVLDEMTARSMVEKASYAIGIADEQIQIAQFAIGEARKQVDSVKAQIAAKQKEIADADSFFGQVKDFFGGIKDAAVGLGKSALGSLNGDGGADGGSVDVGALYKVISSKGGTSAASAGLAGGMAIMAGYGAFVYAGYTSMQSMEEAAAKRAGDLKSLQEVALPAAQKMVELKQREVHIAELTRAIAEADYNLGRKMLAFYSYRFLSKAFWQQLSGLANRLMRRYLDLGGRTAWFAERALSFEVDKDIRVVSFDYFPKQLRGVGGADMLQLHLAELEAGRIYGLSQTIPVKQTYSLMRDFPIAFGQLKKTGSCRFITSETPLRLAYPGVYGYRLRCVSIGLTYADEAFPHKGMLSNAGISMVSNNNGGMHRLLRYPDALPLSEFNMRGDMLVYELPDETLLPFEGSGLETTWELRLSRTGLEQSLEQLTDVLLTFDMRASYSAALDAAQQALPPAPVKKSLLISGRVQNPGAVTKFKAEGGLLTLTFHPALAANNTTEKMRTITFLGILLSGVEQSPVSATLSADTDGLTAFFDLEDGIALSNSGFLAGANGGVPLPLNGLTGLSADQPFTLTIDTAVNAGADFSTMYDVQLVVEYEAVG